MFIDCPSCKQRNPKNAIQCLHCNFQLKAASPEEAPRARPRRPQPITVHVSFSENPILATALTIFALGFLVLWGYLMMNAPDQKCFNSDQSARIKEYKGRGYNCDRELFPEKNNGNFGRPRICCIAPKAHADVP